MCPDAIASRRFALLRPAFAGLRALTRRRQDIARSYVRSPDSGSHGLRQARRFENIDICLHVTLRHLRCSRRGPGSHLVNLRPIAAGADEIRTRLSLLTPEQVAILLAMLEYWKKDANWREYCAEEIDAAIAFISTIKN